MFVALDRKEFDNYRETDGITIYKIAEANDGSVIVNVIITKNSFEINRYNKRILMKVSRILDDEFDMKIMMVIEKRKWNNVGKS